MKTPVGIDVSSEKLTVCILDGDCPHESEIPNLEAEIVELIKEQKLKPSTHLIGVESTGRYHLLCRNIFVRKGFEFRVINPILTSKKISYSIRKKKTDQSDAKHIAILLNQGEGRVITEEQLDETKRSILRTQKTVVDHCSSLKQTLNDLKKLEPNPELEATMKRLEKCIEEIENCSEDIGNIAMNKEQTDAEKLVDSITGFGVKLSAIVAAEIGDFSRFPSSRQLVAFCGIDPKVIQSGNMDKRGRITKRGNSNLRYAFYLAAQVSRIHDPEMKQFFEKKISEGKHFKVAVCAVARKLVERVYAVVMRGTPYKKRQIENNKEQEE